MILAQNWPKTAKSSWHCSFTERKIILYLKSSSLFGIQVRVYLPLYWFCLIGETWDQVIYPWCNAIKKKVCPPSWNVVKTSWIIRTITGGQIKLPLSREEAMILEAAHLNLHQNENLYGHGWKTFHGSCTTLKQITSFANFLATIQLAVTHPPPSCLAVRTLKSARSHRASTGQLEVMRLLNNPQLALLLRALLS